MRCSLTDVPCMRRISVAVGVEWTPAGYICILRPISAGYVYTCMVWNAHSGDQRPSRPVQHAAGLVRSSTRCGGIERVEVQVGVSPLTCTGGLARGVVFRRIDGCCAVGELQWNIHPVEEDCPEWWDLDAWGGCCAGHRSSLWV